MFVEESANDYTRAPQAHYISPTAASAEYILTLLGEGVIDFVYTSSALQVDSIYGTYTGEGKVKIDIDDLQGMSITALQALAGQLKADLKAWALDPEHAPLLRQASVIKYKNRLGRIAKARHELTALLTEYNEEYQTVTAQLDALGEPVPPHFYFRYS